MSDIEMPDFDKMTPEEIQLWMESLAKKQGATEGLITAADMEIADIDPSTVTIDEPGYVPSETFKSSSSRNTQSTPKVTPAKPEVPAAPPTPEPVRPAAAVAPPPPPAPAVQPVTSTPPRGSGERVRLPTERPQAAPPRSTPPPPPAQPQRPAASMPPPPSAAPAPAPTPEPAPAAGGDLAWLESLAAGLPDDGINLDLSALASESAAGENAPRAEAANPESWLESLVSAGGELSGDVLPAPPVSSTPPKAAAPAARMPAYEEPPAWMESLAQSGELETASPVKPTAARPQAGSPDPTDWLASLSASGELESEQPEAPAAPPTIPASAGVDEGTMQDIEQAIREGRVSSEQMQLWLDRQTDMLVQQPEISLEDFYDPDAPPVPAEMPDWFLESVKPPSADEPSSSTGTPALFESLFDAQETPSAPPAAAPAPVSSEMPDWLKADLSTSDQAVDFDSIFADGDEEEESEPLTTIEPTFEVEYDPSDTWAEAFDLEQEQGTRDVQDEPDWYRRNVNDPARIAAVEAMASEAQTPLLDASLPTDEELPPGQRTNVPAWLMTEAAVEPQTDVFADAEEVPDWLRQTADTPIDAEMPAWLVETLGYEEQAEPEPAPIPVPVAQVVTPPPAPRPQPVAPPPAPKPVVALSGDAAQALDQAREFTRGDQMEAGLQMYEALIRKSWALEDVVGDLEGLVRLHRSNPAVYRVLGDGLMRQGKLQQALDTYREALNQL